MSQPARTSLRPIGLPRALEVRTDADGFPVAVTRPGGSGRPRETRVEQVEEVWRVAEAWWRAAPQTRTYFRLILEGGRPITLFRDETDGAWCEQPYSAAAS